MAHYTALARAVTPLTSEIIVRLTSLLSKPRTNAKILNLNSVTLAGCIEKATIEARQWSAFLSTIAISFLK